MVVIVGKGMVWRRDQNRFVWKNGLCLKIVVLPVQGAVVDGLSQMMGAEAGIAGEIGNGSGDA
jgi:hypothetical protein